MEKTYPICDAPLSFRHTNRAATTVRLCQQKPSAVWLSWRSKRYTVSTVSTVLEPSTARINLVVKIKYFSPHNLKSDHHKNFPWWKIFKMVFQFIFIILFFGFLLEVNCSSVTPKRLSHQGNTRHRSAYCFWCFFQCLFFALCRI